MKQPCQCHEHDKRQQDEDRETTLSGRVFRLFIRLEAGLLSCVSVIVSVCPAGCAQYPDPRAP